MAAPLVPSNPGWYTGYVPTATEWATEWANKVDFPAPIQQGGTGAQTVPAVNKNLQQRSLVPGGAPVAVQTLSWYGLQTGTAPVEITLPALSSVSPGDWIELLDIDYNAAVNNIQIFAAGADTIFLWGVAETTALLNISGTRALIVANSESWCLSVW